MSEAREYRRGSDRPARSPSGASSIVMDEGTGAATMQGNAEASKSVMARVALQPRLTCVQKRSRPTPYGDTTPIPLITTRDTSVRVYPAVAIHKCSVSHFKEGCLVHQPQP
jgi:hypothetical protein